MTDVLYTVASGDLRRDANITCWPTQAKLEADFAAAVEALGWSVRRGHPVGEHGFIDSQRAGIEVFKQLPPEAPLVVVEAVWQYSRHVGITRDQFMARHKANHLQVAYAPDDDTAERALQTKAAMFAALGLRVHLCGESSTVDAARS
jgi:hypothetical protein